MRAAVLLLILFISCGTPKSYTGKCVVCSKNFDNEVFCSKPMFSETAYSIQDRKKGAWVECY